MIPAAVTHPENDAKTSAGAARLHPVFLAFARATPTPPPAALEPFLDAGDAWGGAEAALRTLVAQEPDGAAAWRLLFALARRDPARASALPSARPALLALAAEASLRTGDTAAAERLIAAERGQAPDNPGPVRHAAMLAALRRDAAALAAVLPNDPTPDAEARARAVLEALLAIGAGAAATAVLHGPAASSPALHRRFVETGLEAFRRSLNDGADLALLEAIAAAAGTILPILPPFLLAETARLAESVDRSDLIDRLAGPVIAAASIDPPPAWLPGALGALAGGEVALDAAALTRHGLTLHAAGRLARAGLCFALALRLAPDDPAVRLNAGFAAAAAGRREEAAAAFAALAGTADETAMRHLAWPVGRRAGGVPWPHARPSRLAAPPLPAGAGEWPLITLVTPTLNAGAWLEEAILSVLHQDYPRLQYIVVDGGSTDATREILARHRAAIDTLIVEPDRGQAEALNKGLALARGELIGWLNADDMLAPGALHAAAAAWLADPGADILHGPCIVHRDRAATALQAPRLAPGAFTVEALADVFGNWMAGRFFLQPETLFTRRLLESLGGGVEAGLHYVFDYAFWLAAAARGARPLRVDWPMAFYRLRHGQKTSERTASVLEQLRVRDRFQRPSPTPGRDAAIRDDLRKALGQGRAGRPVRLALLDPRLPETFPAPEALAQAAVTLRTQEGVALDAIHHADAVPAGTDIVLRVLRAHDGPGWAERLRAAGFAGPLVGWFVEPDRDPFANAELARLVDLAVPARPEAAPVLANRDALLLPATPAVAEAPADPPLALIRIVKALRAVAAEGGEVPSG